MTADTSKPKRRRSEVVKNQKSLKKSGGNSAVDRGEPLKKPEVEYEDLYEDEFDPEDEVPQQVPGKKAGKKDNAVVPTAIFRQGVDKVDNNEDMEYHSSAYSMLHRLNLPQSCLSFDFLKDDLGASRSRFPLELTMLAGSEAGSENPGENRLYLFHATQLHKTKHDKEDDDDSSVGSSSDEESEGVDEDPIVFTKEIKHWGSVNRVKAMPQNPGVVATFSDQGKVYVFDISAHLKQLHNPSFGSVSPLRGSKSNQASANENAVPIYTFKGHSDEGYALNFSKVAEGLFATGGCDSNIFTHTVSPDGNVVSSANPFATHSDSVEDISFSPSEGTVFCSASVDKTIKVFDTRSPQQTHMISFLAHDSDVNVLSWNENVKYLLASGADDGDFKVWDLRMMKPSSTASNSAGESVGFFNYHKQPITSIRWDLVDDSVLSVACDDGSISVWDLSLEEEDDAAVNALSKNLNDMKIRDKDGNELKLPPQLLFQHNGVNQPKEISFHSQVPGLIGATTVDSVHLFICEPLDPRKALKPSP